ncbi:MAG: ASCH domain-containing protein [Minisyncoccus archaeiphilus]|nr:MAG: ASCH domain-containing protein [Candidatus Parcubacteria bacterium]
MIHRMSLNEVAFRKMKQGDKVIESRLFDEKRQMVKPGDVIEFFINGRPEEMISVVVISCHKYDTFEELFSVFPARWFGGKSKKDLLEEIREFYTDYDQEMYGVIGIMISLV